MHEDGCASVCPEICGARAHKFACLILVYIYVAFIISLFIDFGEYGAVVAGVLIGCSGLSLFGYALTSAS